MEVDTRRIPLDIVLWNARVDEKKRLKEEARRLRSRLRTHVENAPESLGDLIREKLEPQAATESKSTKGLDEATETLEAVTESLPLGFATENLGDLP
jgi:hypothetical protein